MKYVVIFVPKEPGGQRFILRRKDIVSAWNSELECLTQVTNTMRRKVFTNETLAGGQGNPFQVFAEAGEFYCLVTNQMTVSHRTLPTGWLAPDLAADCIKELNASDAALLSKDHSDPYGHLCRTFTERMVPGEDFISDASGLVDLLEVPAPTDMMPALEQLRDEMLSGFARLDAKLKNLHEERKAASHSELSEAASAAVVPLPAESLGVLEHFLSSSCTSYDAALALFALDPDCVAIQKRNANKGRKATFPARVILRFLLTSDAVKKVEYQGADDFGPATQEFICSRARFIMPTEWSVTDAEIMTRIRKCVSFLKKQD